MRSVPAGGLVVAVSFTTRLPIAAPALAGVADTWVEFGPWLVASLAATIVSSASTT